MNNLKLIILLILPCFICTSLPQRPVFLFHGFGDDCKNHLQLPYIICIETGAGYENSAKDIYEQAKIGCMLMKLFVYDTSQSIQAEFVHGFHIIGISQGGLTARLALKECFDIRHLAMTLITSGSPHLGIEGLPNLSLLGVKNDYGIASIGNAGVDAAVTLFKYLKSYPTYTFLQYLNPSGRVKANLIKELLEDSDMSYDGFELVANIMFMQDKLIAPRTTQTFGVDFKNGKWDLFSKSPYFQSLGLGKLWDEGRMLNCKSAGEHTQFTSLEFRDYMALSRDSCKAYFPGETVEETRQAYRDCTLNHIKRRKWRGLVCDQTQIDAGVIQDVDRKSRMEYESSLFLEPTLDVIKKTPTLFQKRKDYEIELVKISKENPNMFQTDTSASKGNLLQASKDIPLGLDKIDSDLVLRGGKQEMEDKLLISGKKGAGPFGPHLTASNKIPLKSPGRFIKIDPSSSSLGDWLFSYKNRRQQNYKEIEMQRLQRLQNTSENFRNESITEEQPASDIQGQHFSELNQHLNGENSSVRKNPEAQNGKNSRNPPGKKVI